MLRRPKLASVCNSAALGKAVVSSFMLLILISSLKILPSVLLGAGKISLAVGRIRASPSFAVI